MRKLREELDLYTEKNKQSVLKRIGIIGHFGGDESFTDGQTVKSKSLYKGLIRAIGENTVIDKIDTYYFKKSRLKLLHMFLKCMLLDRIIIFLPASNARRVLFKWLYYASKIMKKEIYHDCIGGALIEELGQHPEWVKYINEFKGNWMESTTQVRKLKELGVNNAVYIPNFKNDISVVNTKEEYITQEPLKFCTFSRVMPEKGIEDAIIAIKRINDSRKKEIVHLDIYGPIQDTSYEWFNNVVEKADYVSYRGVIDSSKSVEVLKDYYMLLFPTRFFTEGMPGTIIDAMFAGLPVISRRWQYCDDMIRNKYNGIVYDFDKPEELINSIIYSIDNQSVIQKMRNNCIKQAERYSEKTVISQILRELSIEG